MKHLLDLWDCTSCQESKNTITCNQYFNHDHYKSTKRILHIKLDKDVGCGKSCETGKLGERCWREWFGVWIKHGYNSTQRKKRIYKGFLKFLYMCTSKYKSARMWCTEEVVISQILALSPPYHPKSPSENSCPTTGQHNTEIIGQIKPMGIKFFWHYKREKPNVCPTKIPFEDVFC